MDKLTVLMSVFNESEMELRCAVNSVLNQTYSHFEFIIICDNPESKELENLLCGIEKSDERIKIVWNKENIGLALSLNHGHEYATGEFIVRMDADDVCEKERFEKELRFIRNNKCDLVWCSYTYIDEDNQELCIPVSFVEKDEVCRKLPLKNIIHHPTVMMTKDIFERAGMYRNFPCSQDYDLWLRMLSVGADMRMLNEKLLKYRIRPNSTTNQRKFQQVCTLNYIRALYRERCKTGKDDYSYQNYLDYLHQCGVGDPKTERDFFSANRLIEEGKQRIKRGKLVSGSLKCISAFITSGYYRKQATLILKRKAGGV